MGGVGVGDLQGLATLAASVAASPAQASIAGVVENG